jgi:hypothetical protein
MVKNLHILLKNDFNFMWGTIHIAKKLKEMQDYGIPGPDSSKNGTSPKICPFCTEGISKPCRYIVQCTLHKQYLNPRT